MTRPKDFRKYPPNYMDILDLLKSGDAPVEVHFKTMKEANSFRLDCYSFTSAMAADPYMASMDEYGLVIFIIEVRVRDNPPRAILLKKDKGEMSKAVTEAIAAHKEKYGLDK